MNSISVTPRASIFLFFSIIVTVNSFPWIISSIKYLGLLIFFLSSSLFFKNLIPFEEPPQFGFNITGNLIWFSLITSLGDKTLISFLRNFFNRRLLKHRADEIAPECEMIILFLFAREFSPPSSPYSPWRELNIMSGL